MPFFLLLSNGVDYLLLSDGVSKLIIGEEVVPELPIEEQIMATWISFPTSLSDPQLVGYTYQQQAPHARQLGVHGGAARFKTDKKLSGRIYVVSWQFTLSQVATFTDFYETTLVYGKYPFLMGLLEDGAVVTKAVQFVDEPVYTPISANLWSVNANLIARWFPDWALPAGAVVQPYQVDDYATYLPPGSISTTRPDCSGFVLNQHPLGFPPPNSIIPPTPSLLNGVDVINAPSLDKLGTCPA